MHAAEIIVREVQSASGLQALESLRESVREPRKSPHLHSHLTASFENTFCQPRGNLRLIPFLERDPQPDAIRAGAGCARGECRTASAVPLCGPVFAPPGTRWQSRKRRGPAFLLSRVNPRAPKPARGKPWVPPADAAAIVPNSRYRGAPTACGRSPPPSRIQATEPTPTATPRGRRLSQENKVVELIERSRNLSVNA